MPILAVLLAGCGAGGPAERLTGVPPAAAGQGLPVLLHSVRVDIPRGTDLGGYEFGLLCAPPYQRLGWTTARQLLSGGEETVADGLAAGGLDVVGQSRRPFDLEAEAQRAEVQIAGRITGMKADFCNRINWLTGWTEGASGEALVRVEWTLFDRLERRTLLTLTTQGTGGTEGASLDGEFSAVHAALHDAAIRLGEAAQVRHLLSRDRRLTADPRRAAPLPTAGEWASGWGTDGADGGAVAEAEASLPVAVPPVEMPPLAAPGSNVERTAAAIPPPPDAPGSHPSPAVPPRSDGSGAGDGIFPGDGAADGAGWPGPHTAYPVLTIRSPAPFTGPMATRADRVQAGAVLVAAGVGHGSGFIIDGRGHVLTNAHVVGNARRVRVVMADGTALVGVVERSDRRRDVALVKVPDGAWPALPLRGDPPLVSEDVYALGAPVLERYRGTLTRGIVSALRLRDGGQPFIQADVSVQHGNSGGPLLDSSGNVLGIAVSALVRDGMSLGLNDFIPIADALRVLNIRVEVADE